MLDVGLLPLRSDHASLRAMHLRDAAAYAAGAADPQVRAFAHLPESEYTECSVAASIRGAIREGLERGDLAVLTIADPDTDGFVGSLVLFDIDIDAGSVEVGFWMHPDHRGRGAAGAALSLAGELAQGSGLARLTARTMPQNSGAQRVLERAGFVRGARARGVAPSGEEVVLVQYSRELGSPSD